MRISHRWLTELLPGLTMTAGELADRLTMLGVLVDETVRADRGLELVVLGRVMDVEPHPSADRLKLCLVDAGPGPARRIVCGAPIVHEGRFYPVALPGALLPNGMVVGVGEIRGQSSEGMLCSAPELGLEHLGDAAGILELDPAGLPPGAPVAPLLGLDDTVFVLEVPANRPDWESHLGVARELRELAGGELQLPRAEESERDPASGPHDSAAHARQAPAGVTVSVADSAGCPRYMGRVIREVRIGPSQLAVQQRLFALGVRPINNVVDATNYVLLEIGTPLHAFDLRHVRGGEIHVRRGAAGERLLTLDDKERLLDGEMTVIADRDRAVAVGGVMGGAESEVSETTRDVFLEAAFFDPARVRATAARLGLRTEASQRFGRGVDPSAVPTGLRRATGLIEAWAGGTPAGEVLDAGPGAPATAVLHVRPERVSAVTGVAVQRDRVARALAAIDLAAEDADGGLRVRVPGHRFDLTREIDLVEEVARRLGYDRIPAMPLPLRAGMVPAGETDALAELRRRLQGLGLDEAYTPTFLDPAPFGSGFYAGRLLEQANPLAKNERYLRPALVATLLLAARYNLRRGSPGAAFFEIGHVFERADPERMAGEAKSRERGEGLGELMDVREREERLGEPSALSELPELPGVREHRRLGIVLVGSPQPGHWGGHGKAGELDFYDIKGLAEALVRPRRVRAAESRLEWLHPGQQADLTLALGGKLGFVGRLHPRVQQALDLEAGALVAELDLAPLLRETRPPTFEPISAFPRVERDLALVVPEERPAADVQDLLERAALENLVEIRLFDLYRGDQVPRGTKSLAFRLVFQSAERTLTDADVEREVRKLLADLAGVGIRVR